MKYIMYKITINDYIYIGSTRDFNQRKITHKCACKTKELKVYQMIREAGGWDKCEMIPIEEYDCEENLQARIREEHWRREYDANLNTVKAYRTEQERISQKRNKHTCECGGKYTHTHIRTHERSKKHLAYLEKQNLTIL
jgi:hypothetical protein